MLVVLERKNADATVELIRNLGRVNVYLPRPVSAEILEQVDEHVGKYHMPKSTFQRLSRRAKEIVKNRVIIETRRGRFAQISLEEITEILALYRAGASIREIARTMGIPKSTVHYILRQERKIQDGPVKMLIS